MTVGDFGESDDFQPGPPPASMQADSEEERMASARTYCNTSWLLFTSSVDCDRSVLLNSTATNSAEREAHVNFGLRGIAEVDEIKAALEYACPGVVSCADILIIAARDATVKAGGPWWPVALGRKDASESVELLADANLPFPVFPFPLLVQNFARKNFSAREMIVLSGAHTIGQTHCNGVLPHLYNFTGGNNATDIDPAMNKGFATFLKKLCPQGNRTNTLFLDSTAGKFDNAYYKNVSPIRESSSLIPLSSPTAWERSSLHPSPKPSPPSSRSLRMEWQVRQCLLQERLAHKGIFITDSTLITNSLGKKLVTSFAKAKSTFFKEFADGMVKMGNLGVLTGSQGEIRKHCQQVRQCLLQERLAHKGIFITDSTLITNSLGKKLVTSFAKAKSTFFKEFADGMVKMGNLGVLTGSQGEIRKHCQFVN
ncbi:hypothetical protein R1flu_017975 [Riccia fluitans]|uniref:Plant heme peroxidase family profile domain-containing protein n=1 Tax=Riccia fluitans TaxID=41844 RepID=A0ABD1ZEH1_9MARC